MDHDRKPDARRAPAPPASAEPSVALFGIMALALAAVPVLLTIKLIGGIDRSRGD